MQKVWHKCFKDGQESVESDPQSGWPATSRKPENIECVWAKVNKDRRLAVRELETDLGIPRLLCLRFWQRILAWNVWWQNSFCRFYYQSRRNIVLQLLITWLKPLHYECTRFPQEGHSLEGDRCSIVLCTMFLVSCILFNKCLYFS